MNGITESTATATSTLVMEEPTASEPAELAEAEAVVATEAPAASRRESAMAQDAALVDEANALIASLAGDPLMAMELVQSWLRDLGVDVREDTALANQDKSRISEALADAARESRRRRARRPRAAASWARSSVGSGP